MLAVPPAPPLITRQAGILFGPDVTERFLRDNRLTCILRGHEGAPALAPAPAPACNGAAVRAHQPARPALPAGAACKRLTLPRWLPAGPDARALRSDMQPMSEGWTLDHDTPAGAWGALGEGARAGPA